MAVGWAPGIANAVLDALCRNVAWSQPSAVWVKLHVGDPGAAGTANAAVETDRVQGTFGQGTETCTGSAVTNWGEYVGLTAAFGGSSGSTVTGVATANLGAVTATAIGDRTVKGTAVAALGFLTASAAGGRTVHGQAGANLGALTATAAGDRIVHGSAVGALGALTAAAIGDRTVHGAATAALGFVATAVGALSGGAATFESAATARVAFRSSAVERVRMEVTVDG